jgi:hypothetical protein
MVMDPKQQREQEEKPLVEDQPRKRPRTAAVGDDRHNGEPQNGEHDKSVPPGEARRVLKARREQSKGDGNFPEAEPSPQLLDERPEDQRPRDVPKARDDRSAPKGNIPAGQEDRAKKAASSTARKVTRGKAVPKKPLRATSKRTTAKPKARRAAATSRRAAAKPKRRTARKR